jgi:hypothetical protein
LIVVNEKEIYCLDLGSFEKSTIDTVKDGNFTGMYTYVEDEKVHIAVIVD